MIFFGQCVCVCVCVCARARARARLISINSDASFYSKYDWSYFVSFLFITSVCDSDLGQVGRKTNFHFYELWTIELCCIRILDKCPDSRKRYALTAMRRWVGCIHKFKGGRSQLTWDIIKGDLGISTQ